MRADRRDSLRAAVFFSTRRCFTPRCNQDCAVVKASRAFFLSPAADRELDRFHGLAHSCFANAVDGDATCGLPNSFFRGLMCGHRSPVVVVQSKWKRRVYVSASRASSRAPRSRLIGF